MDKAKENLVNGLMGVFDRSGTMSPEYIARLQNQLRIILCDYTVIDCSERKENIEWHRKHPTMDDIDENDGSCEFLVHISGAETTTTLYYDVKNDVWYDPSEGGGSGYKIDCWALLPRAPKEDEWK